MICLIFLNIMLRQQVTKECYNWHLFITRLILNGNNEHETYVNILLSAYSTFLELQAHTTTIHIVSKYHWQILRLKRMYIGVRAVQV